eukprot:903573-Rhodomonas_salina.3
MVWGAEAGAGGSSWGGSRSRGKCSWRGVLSTAAPTPRAACWGGSLRSTDQAHARPRAQLQQSRSCWLCSERVARKDWEGQQGCDV